MIVAQGKRDPCNPISECRERRRLAHAAAHELPLRPEGLFTLQDAVACRDENLLCFAVEGVRSVAGANHRPVSLGDSRYDRAGLHRDDKRVFGQRSGLGHEPRAKQPALLGPGEDGVDVGLRLALNEPLQSGKNAAAARQVVESAHANCFVVQLEVGKVEDHGQGVFMGQIGVGFDHDKPLDSLIRLFFRERSRPTGHSSTVRRQHQDRRRLPEGRDRHST